MHVYISFSLIFLTVSGDCQILQRRTYKPFIQCKELTKVCKLAKIFYPGYVMMTFSMARTSVEDLEIWSKNVNFIYLIFFRIFKLRGYTIKTNASNCRIYSRENGASRNERYASINIGWNWNGKIIRKYKLYIYIYIYIYILRE